MGNSSEATIWGGVMVAWIVFGFGPMLVASADEATGVKNAGTRLDSLSKALVPGFYILLGAWALSWPVIPSTLLALLVSACILAYRSRILDNVRLSPSRQWKLFLSVSVGWLLALQFWGFVWRWQSEFDTDQFVVLHLAIPVLFGVVLVAKSWLSRD